MEHFSIKCQKTKTKVITKANQNRGKYLLEPMRTQSKTDQTAYSAGKRGQPNRDWFSFAYDWSRG